MSYDASMFTPEARAVISPDHMRAWVNLPKPTGTPYTAAAIIEWLPTQGVVHGIDPALVKKAVESKIYGDIVEVARGTAPVNPTPSSYKIVKEIQPFTGLNSNSDGSLQYDELSFLTEAAEGEILAEVFLGTEGRNGKTVKGEEVPFVATAPGETLEGSGFVITDEGRYYRAPQLSHISMVEKKLIVTPLKKLDSLKEEDGAFEFDGNVLIENDVHPNAKLKATGSIFIQGRVVSANIESGRNVLISKGASGHSGFSVIKAAYSVWGLSFDNCEIEAGRDVCANHLAGCEVKCEGKAIILGGRASIAASNVKAHGGAIAGVIGSHESNTVISSGMSGDLVANYENIDRNINKFNIEIQSLQQGMTAIERINRTRAGLATNDPKYREMAAKKNQFLGALQVLEKEKIRTKRIIEQYRAVSIIARTACHAGTSIQINGASMNVMKKMERVKFRQSGDTIEAIAIN